MKQIRVTISPSGVVKAEADGYLGPGCETDVQKLLSGLRAEGETGQEHKSEYYTQQTSTDQFLTG